MKSGFQVKIWFQNRRMKNKRTKTGGAGGRDGANKAGEASKTEHIIEEEEEENDEVDVECDDEGEEKEELVAAGSSPPLVKTEAVVEYPGGGLYGGSTMSMDLFSRFSSYHNHNHSHQHQQHHHLPFQHKLFGGSSDPRASDKSDF